MKELVVGLSGESGIRSEAYVRYKICQEMKWTYYEYMNQPPFFIEEILLIMNQEGQTEKRQAKEAERKAKSARR